VIKIGGSAITQKDKLETLNEPNLKRAARMVFSVLEQAPHLRLIIVHGAGSFGHHQAKQYQVHRGIYKDDSISKAELFKGFCLTRESVCKLSSAVLDSLNKEGVLATGCKAFPAWETATVYDQNHSKTVNVIKHNAQEIAKVVNSGIIPVIHGDCVFDSEQACSILSGDLILETLATELQQTKFSSNPGDYC